MQDVNIYIETSIHGPARKDGAYLYVLECFRDGIPVTREGRGERKAATENQLALAALDEALGRLNCACELRIHTDCQHVLNAMDNSWVRQWQKNEWRTAKGAAVKNAELWEDILGHLDKHLYTFSGGHHGYKEWMQEQLKREKTAHKN